MQPTSLKALANNVLERNRQNNQDATDVENRCNFDPQKHPPKLHSSCMENMPTPPTAKTAKTVKRTFGSKDSDRGGLIPGNHPPTAPAKKRRRQKARLVTKSMVEAWRVGRKWILAHLSDLEAAGWTRAELLRAGRFQYPCGTWAAAWGDVWLKPGATVAIEGQGAIRWTWFNETGRPISQAMMPK